MGGGHDERMTLNQIAEMGWFCVNRHYRRGCDQPCVDILDPAILRPGRFDRKAAVGMSDEGPCEILQAHSKDSC